MNNSAALRSVRDADGTQGDKASMAHTAYSIPNFKHDEDQMKNIKELINMAPITKKDIYLRNQDRLMRNSILPEHERMKLAKKMMFQTKHVDSLA